ncbi:OmpA family protein [Pseudanabaena sp. 'Roaring Creek']|uniref:OmpA family protein n=1 Tax=Pseudanabaena sp. 'Roaring Creek' TaxID=1681830 RepID=UPI0006D7A573|nr:OmpA family protein [Pseudanabaena sp. 'Roaring Creek']
MRKLNIRKVSARKVGAVLIASIGLIVVEGMVFGSSDFAIAETSSPNYQITVNSDRDDEIQPNNEMTLREAMAIANGSLSIDRLSESERAQIKPLAANAKGSRIIFNLPPNRTTIKLRKALPDITSPNLIVDGTTQSGYDAQMSFAREVAIPQPIVAIAPAKGVEILRGLTIVADGVTIKGLSLYGFNAIESVPTTTPSADIFISHQAPPPDTTQQPANNAPFYDSNHVPQGVNLEANWLGIPPTGDMPKRTSSFGVYLFNSSDAVIRHNRIAYHEGSGIVTSVKATGTQILENAITNNGFDGMPHGIYLEGEVANLRIKGNTLCANDGSGIYLFKPTGAIAIEDNRILFNDRSTSYAAIYLMGNDHRVTNNEISNQNGSGVAIAAFPKSDRNLIRRNTFTALKGLSIDLISQRHISDRDFMTGDGINLPRDSYFRRVDTANGAINAPTFLATAFPMFSSNQVNIDGTADLDTEVDIYRVTGKIDPNLPYGSLSEYLTTVKTDANGKFGTSLKNVRVGDTISAIATDSQYGTSEPAFNARIVNPDLSAPALPLPPAVTPVCTTPPQVVKVPPSPDPIVLSVPRQIHFALDRAEIGPTSAKVLDRIADVLKQYPTIVITLIGHTDPRASDAYNLELGFRRARSVRNYLMRRGIASERMTVRSLGETQLASQGNQITDYARDRRVEIYFKDYRDIEIIFEKQEEDLQIESK